MHLIKSPSVWIVLGLTFFGAKVLGRARPAGPQARVDHLASEGQSRTAVALPGKAGVSAFGVHAADGVDERPGTDRLFVAEQSGRIYSIPNDRECRKADLFLDANLLVQRLNASFKEVDQVAFVAIYGLTFHPDFAANRRCFVCYVVRYKDGSRGQRPQGTRVVELRATDSDPPTAIVETEKEIIGWLEGGHNGGCLKFGPDGMLYVSTGDGGNAFPPDGHTSGQDVTNLLAAVLRIDVDRTAKGKPYSIPPDNPFGNAQAGKPLDLPGDQEEAKRTPLPAVPEGVRREIWAYGMRNPWKMSFDRKTGDLWVGDVGWEMWELIYRVKPGDNYGWSLVEGRQPVRPNQKPGPTPVVPPAVEIPHTEAASITGGFVYRGDRLPELNGHYIFGDWETRRFWSIAVDGKTIGPRRALVEPTVRIVGFAERNDGELLLLDYDNGSIHELVRNEAVRGETPFPRKLSETGLFGSVIEHTPAEGVVPFAINVPQWSDYAQGERWLGLPDDSSIMVHPRPVSVKGSMFSRSMDYPKDAVLMKTLSLELNRGDSSSKRRIETQLLHFNGYDWRGYTYRWNDKQSDAELVDATGAVTTFEVIDKHAPGGRRLQKWRFPSRMECIRCHNPWAEFSLAFNIPQLNRGEEHNQLEELYRRGVLADAPATAHPDDRFAVKEPTLPPRERPRLVDPFDESAELNQRARSYLHVNCAHCHRFNGGGSARIYLPFDTPLSKMEAVSTRPSQGTFGIDDARIIAPGDPDPFGALLPHGESRSRPHAAPWLVFDRFSGRVFGARLDSSTAAGYRSRREDRRVGGPRRTGHSAKRAAGGRMGPLENRPPNRQPRRPRNPHAGRYGRSPWSSQARNQSPRGREGQATDGIDRANPE